MGNLWTFYWYFDVLDQVCEAEKDDDNGHALNLKGKLKNILLFVNFEG